MRYITFSDQEFSEYDVCFLMTDLNQVEAERAYIKPYLAGNEDSLLAYSLLKHPKRTPAAIQKEYLGQDLLPVLRQLKVKYLVVCDAEYFKTLTRNQGPEANLGYVVDSDGEYKADDGTVTSFAGFKVVYAPNLGLMFRDEGKARHGIDQAMNALVAHATDSYREPGKDVVDFEAYPETVEEIGDWLQKLYDMDCDLSSDIEGFSLKHYDAGIGSITFCWNEHEGIAFGVDLIEGPDGMPIDRPLQDSRRIRQMLRSFFEAIHERGNKMVWHNVAYDIHVLIYQLFMDHIIDMKGLLKGLEILLSSWDCTKLISYLATNSCSGNSLGLKHQSHEFVGQYSVDVKDIRAIPFKELLKYNLTDGLATWFVYNKNWPILVQDQQEPIYKDLFKPSTIDIVQMQLTGLPIDMQEVHRLKAEMEAYQDDAAAKLMSNSIIDTFLQEKRRLWIISENKRLKKKQRSWEDAVAAVEFKLTSSDDIKAILYHDTQLCMPILDRTDTGQPATGRKTLEKLVNHAKSDEEEEFLKALLDFKSVNKILTAFIPRFLEAQKGPDGWHYFHGNFNLGGTVSGRLSSSNPNLQNLPAKGKWAKKVKRCFKAPPGKILIGLDFDSLEDRISALTTKDPEKLKVYTDGYDGHCLRAYTYFEDLMPDIDPTSVESINSIKQKYGELRNDSKGPTFLLTYGGTHHGIVNQMNWPIGKARAIEDAYHSLYAHSDQWVAERIEQATHDGYVTCAFGLRVRTPWLSRTVLNTSKTPREAQAEARTAGNALGQSWCLLNSRASVEFLRIVRSSQYAENIWPCAHIHDAQYFVIDEDMAQLLFVNTHLVKAVQWQDDPEIYHPDVPLGGEVSVFYPSWAEEMVVPNYASEDQIKELAKEHWDKYCYDIAA